MNATFRSATVVVASITILMTPSGLTASAQSGADAVPPLDVLTVQGDVRRMVDALYEGDVETSLTFAHPDVIERFGGVEVAQESIRESMELIEELGLKLDRLYFPRDPEFIAGDPNEYAIVPTGRVIARGETTLQIEGFQFGARAIGSGKWYFVEGSQVTPELLESVFPDFPPDYEFPKKLKKMTR